ncbi:Gfo/Idh/MocA family protein [Sulfuricaulis sp.]|jgi:scyllo-inositol 2-dehydrogenase (NADP+)|uniref:Gfo/Idh/MocA family protein n=1 Tax=Sulfuricaulis sp. TaxID=2003553 RepID=UPI003559CA1B
MRIIVVGLGIQGYKRRNYAGEDFVAAVDPVNPEAQYKRVEDVPLTSYDAALVCIPDEPKIEVLFYLLDNAKHVLVEKPLWAANDSKIGELETLARAKRVVCYTAYNHRFEPHYVRMRELIRSGKLGRIYRCRMYYGNGTARLVRDSAWRDQGAGVLPDLGSHLLDTVRFWFGNLGDDFEVISSNSYENSAPDHVVIMSQRCVPSLEFEMTLLSWRNHFTCDIFAEKGTAHISSLCKWGPTSFTHRWRILPSGRPPEETVTLTQDDPTWALEYAHFKDLCESSQPADLSNDLWLNRLLRRLGEAAMKEAVR